MSAGWRNRLKGEACYHCGAVRNILVVWRWHPARVAFGRQYPPFSSARAMCHDQAACVARVEKRNARARTRSSCIVLEEPVAPDAPLGTCRWCGEALTGQNGSRRNYCYPDREGRDCVAAWHRSRTYDARVAVRHRDRAEHGCVRCVDCSVICEGPNETSGEGTRPWDADHEVPLEDGGEHALSNLRCRCVPCHTAKTAREARARAAQRRAVA